MTPRDWQRVGELFREQLARERAECMDPAATRKRQQEGMERKASSCSGFNEQNFSRSFEHEVYQGVRPYTRLERDR